MQMKHTKNLNPERSGYNIESAESVYYASRFSLVSKALPYSKIFIYEDSR